MGIDFCRLSVSFSSAFSGFSSLSNLNHIGSSFLLFDSSGSGKVLLPVGACQVCVTNGISGMVHPVISHIQPHMGDVGSSIVGGMETKSLLLLGQDMLSHIVLFLCCPWQGDSCLAIAPLHQSRTVKRKVEGESPLYTYVQPSYFKASSMIACTVSSSNCATVRYCDSPAT